jgi:hypothetical protein
MDDNQSIPPLAALPNAVLQGKMLAVTGTVKSGQVPAYSNQVKPMKSLRLPARLTSSWLNRLNPGCQGV